MSFKSLRAGAAVAAAAFALLGTSQELEARGGGQHWGYQPRDGYPLWNMYWQFASPWGALGGWSIPHHNLEAPHLGPRTTIGSFDPTMHAPTLDRSVAFPGSSSNVSATMPSFTAPAPTAAYRTEKRFDPPYYFNYNSYWHHGYWGGGKWGWGRWGGPLGIASFARWSFGPIYYVSGYGQFRNPFLNDARRAVPGHLDYSQVIEGLPDDDEPPANSTSTDPAVASPPDSGDETYAEKLEYLVKSPEVKAGLKSFDAASEAFQRKDYQSALQKTDDALEQLPDDAAIHEFRALILFARGDYQSAAEVVYAVLAVSPGWDWTTLSGRYSDQEEYPRQLRALEAFHKEHADSAAAALLLAYHYTTCGHYEAAVKQFQTAVRLLPDDNLLAVLAALVAGAVEKVPAGASPEEAGGPRPAASTATRKDQDTRPITKTRLVGEWKAFRAGTTGIQLRLRDDQRFVWVATRDGKARRIAGRYALEGSLLLLEGGSGTLIGRVQTTKGGFNFWLL
ncbi:MAG: tetratricopeptide repeat protein, partial [Deltaproteobacteria bacterium]